MESKRNLFSNGSLEILNLFIRDRSPMRSLPTNPSTPGVRNTFRRSLAFWTVRTKA